MYFLMACNDEPPLSFRFLMALLTISDVGGWFGLARGFFAFFCAPPPEAAFLAAEDGAAAAGCGEDAASAIVVGEKNLETDTAK